MDKLAKATGAEFDRAYMAGQVKDHEDAVALFEKESKDGKDQKLRAWAKETLPTLRHHLKMAREINKTLGGTDRGER
jgi:putative membrane protein